MKYVDPDGKFLAIFYVNQYFNKRVREFAKRNSDEAQSQTQLFFQGYPVVIKTDAMRKALDEDLKNGISYLNQNIDYYLPQLGLDKDSKKSSDYCLNEVTLYIRIQKLRESKDEYGDYRTYLVDKIIDKALKVQKKVYAESINKEGSNKKEALMKSDMEANKLIDEQLKELGY